MFLVSLLKSALSVKLYDGSGSSPAEESRAISLRSSAVDQLCVSEQFRAISLRSSVIDQLSVS